MRLNSFDLCKPSRCALGSEPRPQPLRADRGDAPSRAACECGDQLLPTDGMRAGGLTIGVAETEEVQVPAGTRHRRQAHDVVSPLIVVERMKQRAVEHRVEHPAQTIEVESVTNNEVGFDAARRCTLARDRHGTPSHVDSENVDPVGGEVKGVLARPAARVEHRAGEHARARQTHHRRLWCSNVPGGRTIVVRRIPWLAGTQLMTGRLPPAIRVLGSESCLRSYELPLVATGIGEPDHRRKSARRRARVTPRAGLPAPIGPSPGPRQKHVYDSRAAATAPRSPHVPVLRRGPPESYRPQGGLLARALSHGLPTRPGPLAVGRLRSREPSASCRLQSPGPGAIAVTAKHSHPTGEPTRRARPAERSSAATGVGRIWPSRCRPMRWRHPPQGTTKAIPVAGVA